MPQSEIVNDDKNETSAIFSMTEKITPTTDTMGDCGFKGTTTSSILSHKEK